MKSSPGGKKPVGAIGEQGPVRKKKKPASPKRPEGKRPPGPAKKGRY